MKGIKAGTLCNSNLWSFLWLGLSWGCFLFITSFLKRMRAAKRGHCTVVTQLSKSKIMLKRSLDFIYGPEKIRTILRKLGTGKIKWGRFRRILANFHILLQCGKLCAWKGQKPVQRALYISPSISCLFQPKIFTASSIFILNLPAIPLSLSCKFSFLE